MFFYCTWTGEPDRGSGKVWGQGPAEVQGKQHTGGAGAEKARPGSRQVCKPGAKCALPFSASADMKLSDVPRFAN